MAPTKRKRTTRFTGAKVAVPSDPIAPVGTSDAMEMIQHDSPAGPLAADPMDSQLKSSVGHEIPILDSQHAAPMAPTKKKRTTRSTGPKVAVPSDPIAPVGASDAMEHDPPAGDTVEKHDPPAGDAVEKHDPPADDAVEKHDPPAGDAVEKMIPPASDAVEKMIPPAGDAVEKMIPPAGDPMGSQLKSAAGHEIQIRFMFEHEVNAVTTHLTPRERCPQDNVTLMVDPKLPVRHLKPFLRFELRIPFYEDFKLAWKHPVQGLVLCVEESTLHDSHIKDKDTVWLITDGFSLDPAFYRKFLEERREHSFPSGRPVDEFPDLPVVPFIPLYRRLPVPGELNICFKLAHTLNRRETDPRDSVSFPVDPRMPIGILKIKLRCSFWIPFYEAFELAQSCGTLLARGDGSLLGEYALKDHDTLLLIIKGLAFVESNKMQVFVKSAHYINEYWRFPERSEDGRHVVRLTVEPTLTIGALKLMMQLCYWFPKGNPRLLSEPTPKHRDQTSSSSYYDSTRRKLPLEYTPVQLFDQDTATLEECGINEGHTLLTCIQDGPFKTGIFSYHRRRALRVDVTSCFHTVLDLKMEIGRAHGYDPKCQMLTRHGDRIVLGNRSPLVALGIVKPYMSLMEHNVETLKLTMLQPKRKSGTFCKKKKNSGNHRVKEIC